MVIENDKEINPLPDHIIFQRENTIRYNETLLVAH